MHIAYKNRKLEKICTDLEEAKKHYPFKVAKKLLQAINKIETSESLHDIIHYPPFHFHSLKGKRIGDYTIDVAGRKSGYRLILRFCEEGVSDIQLISKMVKEVKVWEVSNHYE